MDGSRSRETVPIGRDAARSAPGRETGRPSLPIDSGHRRLSSRSRPTEIIPTCLSTGKDLNLPTMVFHSPSPPSVKHKRFSPAVHASQRERLSQLDIGAKYRNFKESAATKFNRDRFSIPELETQNDLKLLIAGTPKQRFSLDSQLTGRNQDVTRSRLLPIASSPINEHQQIKIEEQTGGKVKSPTREGLGRVLVASTTPILPPSERELLSTELSKITTSTRRRRRIKRRLEGANFTDRSRYPHQGENVGA